MSINIHRHSASKTATIRLRRDGDKLRVDVQDYGKGIPPLTEVQCHRSGVGIRGMRERLRQFGGELSIDSDGSGTTISAVLPSK